MPRPVQSQIHTIDRAEDALLAIDRRPLTAFGSVSVVVLVVAGGVHHQVAVYGSHDAARSHAHRLASALVDHGERNAGVALVTLCYLTTTGEAWPATRMQPLDARPEAWLLADLAAVCTFASFLAWAFGLVQTSKSNLQRFGELIAQGLEADDAAAIATGRVQ